MEQRRYNIAILGGTGAQGSGLALRLAAAGHTLTIGSRDGARAADSAAQFDARIGKSIAGNDNRNAADTAEIVVLTVPYAVQRITVEHVLEQLRGKILVDATVPLVPPRVGIVQLPQSQSAVAAIQQLAGMTCAWSPLFKTCPRNISRMEHPIDCDVLVCGNDGRPVMW